MEPTDTGGVPKRTAPKFVRYALFAGIVVLLNVFFAVVISLAYPTPQYETYCGTPEPMSSQTCDSVGGSWNEAPSGKAGPVSPGFCDMTHASCRTAYASASRAHTLYAFLFLIGFGVVALAVGLFPLGSSVISSGLSYGGALALVIASIRYWGDADNWIRLVIVTVGLAVLLTIGVRRFKD